MLGKGMYPSDFWIKGLMLKEYVYSVPPILGGVERELNGVGSLSCQSQHKQK